MVVWILACVRWSAQSDLNQSRPCDSSNSFVSATNNKKEKKPYRKLVESVRY